MPLDREKHVVSLQGKEYVLYAGVLSLAHEKGLLSIETLLVQIPGPDNEHTAIVKARVEFADGQRFEEYGDASPRNVTARIATALIRMAATRAKGRAMRDAVNVGETLAEELPPEPEPARAGQGAPRHTPRAEYPQGAPEQPEPVEPKDTPGSSPRAETWVEPTTGQILSRADLLKGCERLTAKAKEAGINAPAFYPKTTSNERLFALGRALVETLRKAGTIAAMEDGEQPLIEAPPDTKAARKPAGQGRSYDER